MALRQPTSSSYGDEIEMLDRPHEYGRRSGEGGKVSKTLTSIADINSADSIDNIDESMTDPKLEISKSTHADAVGMKRMGKQQQFVRHFRLISTISFVTLCTASWEIGLFVITPGLTNGGRAGLLWNVIWNIVGFAPIYVSMAEMASMAPIAGAQYHWVSEFAPEKWQRILSYISGWTSTIAWQAGNAQGVFLLGTLVQTMILINDDGYGFPNWQGTLLAFLAVIIAFVGAVYGYRILPYWQNAVFMVHILAYLAYIIPQWVSAPRVSHTEVWLSFENNGGWSNMGLAVLVGQLAGIGLQCNGVDAAAHISEEVKDASYAVPRTIVAVYLINSAVVLSGIITIVYHIDDVSAAVDDPTTYPALYVLRGAMSVGWMTVVIALIALLCVASNIVYLAAVTRDLFAFARDQGLPFSRWIGKIDEKRHIPVNATLVSQAIACLMALIYLGSPVAFYAITSLFAVALLQGYSLSVACLLWRRLKYPETLPPSEFSLGRWGVPVNIAAVVYATWAFFWAVWPQDTPVTAGGFNWSSPIFVLCLIVAALYFVFKAKNTYVGPVTEVEGRKQRFQ